MECTERCGIRSESTGSSFLSHGKNLKKVCETSENLLFSEAEQRREVRRRREFVPPPTRRYTARGHALRFCRSGFQPRQWIRSWLEATPARREKRNLCPRKVYVTLTSRCSFHPHPWRLARVCYQTELPPNQTGKCQHGARPDSFASDLEPVVEVTILPRGGVSRRKKQAHDYGVLERTCSFPREPCFPSTEIGRHARGAHREKMMSK